MNEELDKRIREIANKYVSECWGSYLDLSEVDLISAGIGVALEATKELEEKLEQAEKENAELQQKWLNESYEKAKLVEKWKHNGENIIQECKDIEGAKTYYEHQLTKAKNLLAKWVELFKPKGGNMPPTPIQVVTEQFLKDLEK